MIKKLIILIIFFSLNSIVSANPQWVWGDDFSDNEQQRLTEWIEHSISGLEKLYGKIPYQYKVYFYRKNDGSGPVPWANTDKRSIPSAHFHVNMKYSRNVLIKDWTAAHELSHLLFPYLGRSGMWFSEGLASYLQYQIMYANNTKSWDQVVYKLNERFDVATRSRQFDNISILELNDIVFQSGAFVRLYWSGAAYFLNVDKDLHDIKDSRLNDIIKEYLNCCHNYKIYSFVDMIELFDSLSNSKIFSNQFDAMLSNKGFPNVKESMQWIKNSPPKITQNIK
jgi:hypothetical protein